MEKKLSLWPISNFTFIHYVSIYVNCKHKFKNQVLRLQIIWVFLNTQQYSVSVQKLQSTTYRLIANSNTKNQTVNLIQ